MISEMKKLAIKEATALKKHATKKELNKLNVKRFDSNDPCECIYGQMTGNCYGARAQTLIIKCCTHVYIPLHKGTRLLSEAKLNGEPYPTNQRQTKYHSPIEMLVYKDETSASKIIDFLKGKTNKIEL